MRGERASLQTVRSPGRYRPPPPRETKQSDLDPHKQPDTPWEAAERASFLADQTPGLDEAHCIYGHPNYQPRRTAT